VTPDDEDELEAEKFSKTMNGIDELLEHLRKLSVASEEAKTKTKTKRVVEFVRPPGMDDMQKYFERGV
jgi:hypothetical protein